MTAIAAATQSAAPPPRTAPVPAQGDAPSAGQTTAPSTPAVLNDVAVARSDAAELPRARADAGQVSNLLDHVAGHNGFVDIYLRRDWKGYEALHGGEKLQVARGGLLKTIQASETRLEALMTDYNIPMRHVPTGPGPDAPVALVVGEFSIRSAGTSYEVRAGADGAMVGTQGGRPWRSWQVLPSTAGTYSRDGAPVALQALASLRHLAERTITYKRDGSESQPPIAIMPVPDRERPPSRLL